MTWLVSQHCSVISQAISEAVALTSDAVGKVVVLNAGNIMPSDAADILASAPGIFSLVNILGSEKIILDEAIQQKVI